MMFAVAMKNEYELAKQAAHQAGRAAVMHALVNGLLATQRLDQSEIIAFYKTMRNVLEEEVTKTGHIQDVLLEEGFEQPARTGIVAAFRGAIELQLRLIDTEIAKSFLAN